MRVLEIAVALALASGVAHAQVYTPKFDPDPYVVTSDPQSLALMESASPLDHALSAGLILRLGGAPLEACVQDSAGNCVAQGALVSGRFAADLVTAIGFGRVGLHAQLPVILHQGSDFDPQTGMNRLASAAIGDLRLGGKLALVRGEHAGLGLDVTFSLPTGGGKNFVGNDGTIIDGRALFDYRAGRLGFGANVGYAWHSQAARLANLYIDDEFVWAAGVELGLSDPLSAGVSVSGRIGLVKDPMTSSSPSGEERPMELLASMRYWATPSVAIEAGAGPALTSGYGPSFRALAGLRWMQQRAKEAPADPDRDHDGIANAVDKCPDEAEDRDGFQDEDGCPDLDNDGDGIADAIDKCPNEAEDKDGFKDDDGCADPDNDNDGVLDAADKCPLEAEDKDGFEDDNGCPDADNDGDGILDLADKCPNEAEDKDGFQDEDGCPDPDNDGDGIADAKDKCPNEAEVYNAFEDEDGCPDKGKPLAVVTATHVEINETIYFDTNKARIKSRSFKLLDAVVGAVNAHSGLRIRIEGHTDDTGTDEWNNTLSQQRAESVRDYLVKKGVGSARLEAIGFGRTRPKAEGKTDAVRSRNRRVEFVIIEQPQPAQTPAPTQAPTPASSATPTPAPTPATPATPALEHP
ncbi:MAG: putative internalin [Myxococcales bacterium]|nr:putative internalin [Myxococcales bacterium]